MSGEADDKKIVEIMMVGMIGKAKIKTDEIDRDALDLISRAYSFVIRSVFCCRSVSDHFLFYFPEFFKYRAAGDNNRVSQIDNYIAVGIIALKQYFSK